MFPEFFTRRTSRGQNSLFSILDTVSVTQNEFPLARLNASGMTSWVDADAANSPQRFYRATQLGFPPNAAPSKSGGAPDLDLHLPKYETIVLFHVYTHMQSGFQSMRTTHVVRTILLTLLLGIRAAGAGASVWFVRVHGTGDGKAETNPIGSSSALTTRYSPTTTVCRGPT